MGFITHHESKCQGLSLLVGTKNFYISEHSESIGGWRLYKGSTLNN